MPGMSSARTGPCLIVTVPFSLSIFCTIPVPVPLFTLSAPPEWWLAGSEDCARAGSAAKASTSMDTARIVRFMGASPSPGGWDTSSGLHTVLDHHPEVFVLEVVAVEHVGLVAGERMREVERDPHRLARPREHGVEQPAVLRQQAVAVGAEDAYLRGRPASLEHAELEAVDVHRVRHARTAVLDQPRLAGAAPHGQRSRIHLELPAVDRPVSFAVVGEHDASRLPPGGRRRGQPAELRGDLLRVARCGFNVDSQDGLPLAVHRAAGVTLLPPSPRP